MVVQLARRRIANRAERARIRVLESRKVMHESLAAASLMCRSVKCVLRKKPRVTFVNLARVEL